MVPPAHDYCKRKEIMGLDITSNDMLEESLGPGESEIRKTFAGATVLLSGGTGFVGKLMIEKLLRCCPELKKLYVIIRPKKGKDMEKRLDDQLEQKLYSKMKKECRDYRKKIIAVAGDVSEIGIGFNDHDREMLINEVNFIFHGAATVRFDETLKKAVETNTRGTREMLLLARSCKNLKAMVHVSTAFSNCHLEKCEERFYDFHLSGDKLIDLVESLNEKILNDITKGLMGKYPNTYTYSKAAAENIVLTYSKGLPVALLRPSIILATSKEPLEGWIDNIYGPGGIVLGSGLGVIRTMAAGTRNIADIIPGDYVVNASIAVAWKVSRLGACDVFPPSVYACATSSRMPLTWGDLMKKCHDIEKDVSTTKSVYYVLIYLANSMFWYKVLSFLLHWIPAYIVDGVAYLTGNKPMLRNIYRKYDKMVELTSHFSYRDWIFKDDNLMSLYNELPKADKEIFYCDVSILDWDEYLATYVRGVRAYLLNEDPETIPEGKKKQKKFKYLHYFICTMLFSITVGLFYWFLCLLMF